MGTKRKERLGLEEKVVASFLLGFLSDSDVSRFEVRGSRDSWVFLEIAS